MKTHSKKIMKFALMISMLFAVQACKTSSGGGGGTKQGNDNGCFEQGTLKCTEKPGLYEKQKFTLSKDLILPGSDWIYYVDGLQVDSDEVLSVAGQDFCAINISSDRDGKVNLPDELNQNGKRTIPKSIQTYELYEISWYVSTVFFEGILPDGQEVGFVIHCGQVEEEGAPIKDEVTSLERIEKHFKGYLSEQK